MVIINERDLHVCVTLGRYAQLRQSEFSTGNNRPLDFNIAGDKKFIGVASDSHCNYGLRNYDLSSSATVSKEDTQNSHLKKLLNDQSSLFQIYV